MVKNVKQKDLRQMFPAKVSKLKESKDVETDIKVVDGIPSSSTDIVAEAQGKCDS